MRNSKMRTLLLAGVSSIAITTYASAADAPVYKLTQRESVYNWTGMYFGIHGGYGTLDHKQVFLQETGPCGDITGATCSLSTPSWVLGAQIGSLWQSGTFAWGVEADISRTGFNSTTYAGGDGYTFTGKVDWLASLRARAGYVSGSMFGYVTAGLAAGNLKSGWSTVPGGPGGGYSSNLDAWKLGYVVGAGLEHALAPNKTIRAELLYYDLGTTTSTLSVPGLGSYATDFSHRIFVTRIAFSHRW